MRIPKAVTAIAGVCEEGAARYAMNGVLVGREDKKPFAVATDGRRMIHATWNEDQFAEFNDEPPPVHRESIIIPKGTFKEMAALCNGARKRNSTETTNYRKRVFLDETNGEVVSRFAENGTSREVKTLPVEGKFPKWKEVFGQCKEPTASIRLSGSLFLSTLKAVVAVLESQGSHGIDFDICGEILRITGEKDGTKVVAVQMSLSKE